MQQGVLKTSGSGLRWGLSERLLADVYGVYSSRSRI